MAKKYSVKAQTNLFKTFGLLALVIFTFYFIYNYLATGSFSLKPRASEIVDTNGGVATCGALLTEADCLKVNGCKPSTTASTTQTLNCENSDCDSGNYGCHYVKISKTVNQTQTRAVYECDDGSGVSQSKCIQLGGSWIKTGTETVTVPVTTTINDCRGTYTRTIPGKFICTGTPIIVIKPTPTPKDASGLGVAGGGIAPPTLPVTTCSTGMTQCNGNNLRVCVSGIWKDSPCASKQCDSSKGVCVPVKEVSFVCDNEDKGLVIDKRSCVRSVNGVLTTGVQVRTCGMFGIAYWSNCSPILGQGGGTDLRTKSAKCNFFDINKTPDQVCLKDLGGGVAVPDSQSCSGGNSVLEGTVSAYAGSGFGKSCNVFKCCNSPEGASIAMQNQGDKRCVTVKKEVSAEITLGNNSSIFTCQVGRSNCTGDILKLSTNSTTGTLDFRLETPLECKKLNDAKTAYVDGQCCP